MEKEEKSFGAGNVYFLSSVSNAAKEMTTSMN
jgi:hypothetical protein